MRGIAGIIRFDQEPISPAKIARLINTMAVGPTDRIQHVCEGSAGLAHLVKYIQPEDHFESQPLKSADGNLILVTDAIVENRDELAREFRLSSTEQSILPDSAFVLRAYEKWGAESPRHLDGRFAFAVWHVREQRLFCAVDHFALRPLYYCKIGSEFAFATTLRGLLSLPGVSRHINEGVLADFLLYTRTEPRERTLYSAISSLPAAHHLCATTERVSVERYWAPDASHTLRLDSSKDYVEAFAAEFENAVAAGLRVTGNIGIMVSGGLDSAAATAVAGRILQREGKRLQAIHKVPSSGDPRRAHLREHDESSYVRLLQQHSPHIDFHFMPSQADTAISLSRWSELFDQHCVPLRAPVFENPVDMAAPFALDRLLNGLGGNAIVSMEYLNTPYLSQLAVTLRWRRLLAEMRGQKRVYGRSLKHTFRRQVLADFLPNWPITDAKIPLLSFLNPDFVHRGAFVDRMRQAGPHLFEGKSFSVRRMSAHVLKDIRPQHVGIASSVISAGMTRDVYQPFFNRRLNEFCMAVPPSLQMRDGWDRLLLRQAMKGLLPDAVAWRKTRGFPLPDSWRPTLSIRAAMPAALDQMKQSSLVGEYLNLDLIERRLVPEGLLEQGGLGVFPFVSLFNVGWFLHWLGAQGD